MMKEETKVESITKEDQDGNHWTGICLSTTFHEHEKMKGLTLKQYALTLPEVPVVAVFAEIDQWAPRTFAAENITLEAFLKPDESLSSCFARVPTEGVFHTYYAGVEEYELESGPSVVIGSDGKSDHLMMVHPETRKLSELYMNQDVFLAASVHEWSAPSQKVVAVEPTFFIIGEHKEPWKQHPFHRISFKGK
ncbi:hypothetical protein LC065_01450 [Halobacillus litoralis]|uniref:hypothetical protein n=1 Tax=Halobacillus litoralis TaxID=45668 RepID=UPI00273D50AA|nr:hypothetical protein [Halobacillus litoralis]WLR47988.1 hypothetical protein LC065_01450 [Halobacillus litoralis]